MLDMRSRKLHASLQRFWSALVDAFYLSSFLSFIDSRAGQISVVPAAKPIFLVVDALSVTNHYDLVSRRRRHCHQLCCSRFDTKL